MCLEQVKTNDRSTFPLSSLITMYNYNIYEYHETWIAKGLSVLYWYECILIVLAFESLHLMMCALTLCVSSAVNKQGFV